MKDVKHKLVFVLKLGAFFVCIFIVDPRNILNYEEKKYVYFQNKDSVSM